MVKAIVLYNQPVDPAAFGAYFDDVHVPIALKIPNAVRVEVTIFGPGPDGAKPPFNRMAELTFSSPEEMGQALSSAAGGAAAADFANFASGGVTLLTGAVQEYK